MAHAAQLEFVSAVRARFPEYFRSKRVLEIGSAGSQLVRNFFQDCDYVGVDLAEGVGVDVVCPGNEFRGDTAGFDVAISCECFEHNPFWLETFENMIRMVRPGGMILVTCATGTRGEHGTLRFRSDSSLSTTVGWTYYKNLDSNDFISGCALEGAFDVWEFFEYPTSEDLYFVGLRQGSGEPCGDDGRMAELKAAVDSFCSPRRLTTSRRIVLGAKRALKTVAGSDEKYQDSLYWIRTRMPRFLSDRLQADPGDLSRYS